VFRIPRWRGGLFCNSAIHYLPQAHLDARICLSQLSQLGRIEPHDTEAQNDYKGNSGYADAYGDFRPDVQTARLKRCRPSWVAVRAAARLFDCEATCHLEQGKEYETGKHGALCMWCRRARSRQGWCFAIEERRASGVKPVISTVTPSKLSYLTAYLQ
jgi:hypothetical protein